MRLSLCLLSRQGMKRWTSNEIDSNLGKWSKAYANLPERFILRKSRKLEYKPPVANQAFSNEFKVGRIPVRGRQSL